MGAMLVRIPGQFNTAFNHDHLVGQGGEDRALANEGEADHRALPDAGGDVIGPFLAQVELVPDTGLEWPDYLSQLQDYVKRNC